MRRAPHTTTALFTATAAAAATADATATAAAWFVFDLQEGRHRDPIEGMRRRLSLETSCKHRSGISSRLVRRRKAAAWCRPIAWRAEQRTRHTRVRRRVRARVGGVFRPDVGVVPPSSRRQSHSTRGSSREERTLSRVYTVQSPGPYQMSHLLHAKMSQIWDMFVRATCFSYIDFLDIDGLIKLEVGNKNVQRFETERLRHTRALRESTS